MSDYFEREYLIDDDGRCFYPMASGRTLGFDTRSEDVTAVVRDNGATTTVPVLVTESADGLYHDRRVWLITDERVDAFVFAQPASKVVVQYRLKDEAAQSERFPLTLTPEEWRTRRDIEDPDGDGDSLMHVMYQAIREERENPPIERSVADMTPLTGGVDEHPEWSWEVERTAGMLYGRYYWHQLPGTLTGVHDRLAAAIRARYGGYKYLGTRTGLDVDRSGVFILNFHLPYDVPVFRNVSRYSSTGRKLKGTDTVRESVSVSVKWEPVRTIMAANKALAIAEYERYERETLEWLASYDLTVCSHCHGRGYTETSGWAPTPPAKP